jgi:MFS family permease
MATVLARMQLTVRALSHRNFRLFFIGQGVSLIGTWMQQIATAWLVYRLTGSAFLLGLVGCAGQIPTLFLAPLAGLVADRYDRRLLLFVTQVLSMGQAVLLAALAFGGIITVGQVIVLTFLVGIVGTFDMIARQVFLRDLIPATDDLGNAIALNSLIVNVARLIGPVIAGITIALTGEGTCFLLNGLSYVAVIVALAAIHVSPKRATSSSQTSGGLREGVAYASGFGPVRELLILLALVSLAGAPYGVLLPLFATEVLNGGPETLGYLTAAGGLGALIAACRLAGRQGLRGIGVELAATAAVFGAGLTFFAYTRTLPLAMVVLFVLGFSQMVLTAGINTVLHALVDEDKRGRVMSFFTLAAMGVTPLGSLMAGALAHHLGVAATVMAGGPICLLASFLFARKVPRLRKQAMDVVRNREQARSVSDFRAKIGKLPDSNADKPAARAA